MRVFVVEDDRDLADLTSEALRALGHTVAVATNAPRALADIRTFVPDLVLVDIVLPVFDGNDLASTIRSRITPAPRLVAMTAWKERVKSHLFDGVLAKPFSRRDLVHVLEPLSAAGSDDDDGQN